MVLCKVRLVGAWIKRRERWFELGRLEVRNRGKIFTEKDILGLEEKIVEGDGGNVENMWEQVKRAMVESAREVCGSVRVEEGCLEGGVGS